MQALSSADCLDLWERGLRLHPLDRGLLALGAAFPGTPYESLADWPLGRRNHALAELRCACFGRNLQGQISCPQCAEKLEFQMDGQVLLKKEAEPHHRHLSAQEGAEGSARASVVVKGHSFRLPSTRDLARVARETEPRSAVIQLVESCRTDPGERADWLDEDLEEIGERMASADPMAEIRLTFDCAKCGHQWGESLDIVAFLWLEIEARAKRLLAEVHTLAAAYGWTEKEILSLNEPRRRLYLNMVSA
jgi:hypothetical protein